MTRNLLIYALALTALPPSLSLRQGAHQLRDLLAYPKYEIQFLNDLPLARSEAERWTSDSVDWEAWTGLPGDNGWRLTDGSGEQDKEGREPRRELIPMNFAHPDEPDGPPYPYLCMMPSANSTFAQTAQIDALDEDDEVELDPKQGWAAMSHLDGKCLYSRQGWFTYSYCHNSHIRQFRQAAHAHPHPPGGVVPAEDSSYDAYTLGQVSPGARQRSAAGPGPQSDQAGKQGNQQPLVAKSPAGGGVKADDSASSLTTARTGTGVQNQNPSVSVSFGHGASSRYLVQRWSYGTRCDKTGRPREVEVQIHCSMTTGDLIYMIKEISICQYVVIIHSPYLCDLPGFKSRDLGEIQAAPIRCRQVVDDEDYKQWELEKEKERERENQSPNHGQRLELPFGKRPTGADNPLHELLEGKPDQGRHQFGLEATDGSSDGGTTEDEDGMEDVEIVFSGQDVPEDQLKMLRQALESLSKRAKGGTEGKDGHGEGEEVVFYSWEEGDNGEAVLIDADLVSLEDTDDGKAEGKGKVGLGGDERKVLEGVLREYLNRKEKGNGEIQGKEEKGKKVKGEL